MVLIVALVFDFFCVELEDNAEIPRRLMCSQDESKLLLMVKRVIISFCIVLKESEFSGTLLSAMEVKEKLGI